MDAILMQGPGLPLACLVSSEKRGSAWHRAHLSALEIGHAQGAPAGVQEALTCPRGMFTLRDFCCLRKHCSAITTSFFYNGRASGSLRVCQRRFGGMMCALAP